MRQTGMVSTGRSVVGRLLVWLLVIGVLAYAIKDPVRAAAHVRNVWDWGSTAVDRVAAFVDSLAA